MEYITAEQFLEQPKEVQKVFLDWWKSNISQCDLIYNIKFKEIRTLTDKEMFNSDLKRNLIVESSNIPLLTEGQLRKFIEDKTGCKISISPSLEGKYYIGYDQYAKNEDGDLKRLVYSDDVLKGLWKVALEIAKEMQV